MIRVLLVDDHAVVRAGYHRFLEHTNRVIVVGEAGDAKQGYALFIQHVPDVSIVDLSLPGAGGLELIRRIVAHESAAKVLVFSMHEDPMFATRALEAGARGYVTKRSAPETLVEAVLEVQAGRTFLSPDISREIGQRTAGASPLAELSAKEFEVFRLIAEGRSLSEIAQTLSLSLKTVANYQTLVRSKLGVATAAELVHVALSQSVIQPPK